MRRHPPGKAVQAREHGRGQRCRAVLVLKGVEDGGVVVAVVDGGGELDAHLVRVWAADVVALAQKLIAAAGAHDGVAQLVVARAVGGVGGVRAEGHDERRRGPR